MKALNEKSIAKLKDEGRYRDKDFRRLVSSGWQKRKQVLAASVRIKSPRTFHGSRFAKRLLVEGSTPACS